MTQKEFLMIKIRELRVQFNGGISQTTLAESIGTTANTISRWETGEYRPKVDDLCKLSKFFGVPVSRFIQADQDDDRLDALIAAAQGLDEADMEELVLFAEFINMRKHGKRKRPGRKRKSVAFREIITRNTTTPVCIPHEGRQPAKNPAETAPSIAPSVFRSSPSRIIPCIP